MAIKSLWGELPEADTLRTPALLLKEQAQALTQLTHALLEGRVHSYVGGRGKLASRLRIVAPLLNGFAYDVVTVIHGVDNFYPLEVIGPNEELSARCDSEAEFQQKLELILGSKTVQRVLASLLAQSRQTDEVPLEPHSGFSGGAMS